MPDWVCEILSPGTRRFDLTEKRALYGAHGASFLWLLDPQAELLEAFALQGGAWVLAGTAQGERRGPPRALRGDGLSALGALALKRAGEGCACHR